MITVGVLLAAGRSSRFGNADKLLAAYLGRTLVSHAADAMRAARLDHRVAVVSSHDVAAELDGFQHVSPYDRKSSLSASIKAGILCAEGYGADRVVIALGDMPFVTPGHLSSLVTKCSGDTPSATTDGMRSMAPACFPGRFFPFLASLDGDAGARKLLQDIPAEFTVAANAEALIDMDTPWDLCNRSGGQERAEVSPDDVLIAR
jgi:molybdenum cofactor cytidylyltransferase